jgi:serine/threonine protein kinase
LNSLTNFSADLGPLFQVLSKKGSFSEHKAALLIKQILSALFYCHKTGIVHRDLQPENLLLQSSPSSSNPIVKVANFHMAFRLEEGLVVKKPTGLEYKAPETLVSEEFTEAVDMWAVGVIAYIM